MRYRPKSSTPQGNCPILLFHVLLYHHLLQQVTVTNFVEALNNRRLSLKIDNLGNVLKASDTPQFVFGFQPAVMVGHNLNHCLDVFTGIPVQDGEHGLDMQHILADMVSK